MSSERRAFFARLRADPIFLLKHVPALSSAVYRRLRTKMAIAASRPHRGRKRWPDWVGDRGTIALRQSSHARLAAHLPSYRGIASGPASQPVGEPRATQSTPADPEDQFAEHRWSFLLEALFDHTVDWQSGLDQCTRWVETHADRNQPAWEPYSACERVTNLLVYLAVMPSQLRQREIAPELLRFLDDSIDWIYGHLEYYGPLQTNNHIIGNARALVIAGVATGNAAAVGAGIRIFRRWLPELIMSGGFLRERSSHYQLIVLNWLMDAWHFLVAYAGRDSADAEFLQDYTSRMLSAASMICDPRGRLLALIGDVSPDATPGLSLARLARLYPDRWPAPQARRPPAEVRDGWFRISAGQEVVLGNLPTGQFPLKFPTHGHCDITGFAWIHCGAEVLVDPGRFRYTPDPVSLSQASAPGHNLPTVNGLAPVCESLVVNGQWWPRPYADAELQVFEREGAIVLIHDGFARATPVSRHERQIVAHDGGLIVLDSFDGRGTVAVDWRWHFGPGFDSFEPGELVASGRCGQVRMSVEGLRGSSRVAPVSGAMPGGWASSSYGRTQPGLGMSLHWDVELPAVISTRFELKLLGGQRSRQ